MAVKIAYITGCTHSGSTMMNRVLGAHSRAVNVGGVKNLPDAVSGRKKCTCGAPTLGECPFWSAVDETLYAEAGRRLADLRPKGWDVRSLRNDYVALLSAIQRASGAQVVVDSSRQALRLGRLYRLPGVEVVPVHLFKTPQAQAGSWKRKGWALGPMIPRYWRRNLAALVMGRWYPRTVWVSYERFCQDPESELKRILDALELDYEPEILRNWGSQSIHVLGGNRMRRDSSAELRLDESWRERLTESQMRTMERFCGPLWNAMIRRVES